MRSRRKQYDDDDGRVIANMDVEGMRGFEPKPSIEKTPRRNRNYGPQMTRSEARQYTMYSLMAASIIVLVFSATWILFTLFLVNVWAR